MGGPRPTATQSAGGSTAAPPADPPSGVFFELWSNRRLLSSAVAARGVPTLRPPWEEDHGHLTSPACFRSALRRVEPALRDPEAHTAAFLQHSGATWQSLLRTHR